MKHKHIQLSRRIALSLAIFVLAAAATIFIMRQTHADISPSVSPTTGLAQKTPGTPQFSFQAAAAPGWRQGPIDKVSLALFSNDEASGCWTSVEHKTGTVDVAAELQKAQTSWTNDQNYTIVSTNILPVTLQTASGKKQYDLHQFTLSSTGGRLYGGQEFGYLLLAGGYIKVQGYCNTADQLASITPALQAITFDATK